MRAALTSLAILLACASAQPAGPRALGSGSQLFFDDGQLDLRYSYEVGMYKEIEVFVDMVGAGSHTVGEVEVVVALEGFELTRGELRWTESVPPGDTRRHSVRVQAVTETPALKITSTRDNTVVGEASFRFLVSDDEVRLCSPEDEKCKR